MSGSNYTSANFTTLTGLEPVQHRPSMYTDTSSPLHCITEILDNSLDESVASSRTSVSVKFDPGKGSIEIRDYGRGIPFDIHPQYGRTGVSLAFTELHSGAKFYKDSGAGAYVRSGGLHGVGAAVVNALSLELTVTVYRGGEEYCIRYEHGVQVSEHKQPSSEKTGTLVLWTPDPKYYRGSVTLDELRNLLERKAAVSGVPIDLEVIATGKVERVRFNGTIHSLLLKNNPLAAGGKEPPLFVSFGGTGGNLSERIATEGVVAFQLDALPGTSLSFYNNIFTPQGGDHASAMAEAALTAALECIGKYIPRLDKARRSDIALFGVVSVKVPGQYQAELAGQQKTALSCLQAHTVVYDTTLAAVRTFFSESADAARRLAAQVVKRINRREAAAQARTAEDKKPSPEPKGLDKPHTWGEDSEIFIVEGASAKDKTSLSRRFQGMLPLRGNPTNAYRSGAKDPNLDWIISKSSQVGKIIILTDADAAGAGIASLVLAYFLKRSPHLFTQGKIFVVQAPLYKIEYPDADAPVFTSKLPDNLPEGTEVIRFKGLGEMGPENLKATCTSPQGRTLIPITVDDLQLTQEKLDVILGASVQARLGWLNAHEEIV